MATTLDALLNDFHYAPGWTFAVELIGFKNYLSVLVRGFDTYNVHRGQSYYTDHKFIMPEETPPDSWQRWLFDRIMDVYRHEAMENFQVGNERPYAPVHSRKAGLYYTMPP